MSRSLVGSSSSSTFGSVSSSRSSWKRRRSPPDRSPTRAVSRSPVKPNRSSIALAVISPSAVRVTRRIDSTVSSTRASGSSSSTCWVRCCSATVRPCCTRPADGASSPGEEAQHRRLAGAVDADDADPVARPEPPGRVLQQHPVAAHEVGVLDVDDVLAEPLGGEPLELEPVARRRVRRRSARWRRRSGTSASTSAPAGRGAARRAPCGPGSAGGSPRPPPAAAARPWRARTRRTRPRRRRPRRRGPPTSTGRPRRGTTGRG